MPESSENTPRKKPVRNPKNPSLLKGRDVVTELDLWNFADDNEPIQLESRTSIEIPEPTIRAVEEDFVEDIVVVREPACGPKKAKVITPYTPSEPSVSRDLSSTPTVAQLSASYQKPGEEIWEDLDDIPFAELASTRDHSNDEDLTVDEEPELAAEEAAVSINKEANAVVAHDPSEEESDSEEEPEKAKEVSVDQNDTPAKSAGLPKISPFSRIEKIASLVFLASILLIGIGAVVWFKKNVKAEVDLYAQPDFPVNGSYVKVDDMESYWRTPVTSGNNPDPVKLNVTFIPELVIQIPHSQPAAGSLRVRFLDSKGDTVGDTVTRGLASADASSDRKLKFACTAGFSEEGEMFAYRAKAISPWRVEVYEAPSLDASSGEYKLLFSAPVSSNQK